MNSDSKIDLSIALRHLAWSNQKFFSYFGDQPDEVFDLRAANGEWPVGKILIHFARSGEWFRYCLNQQAWSDLKRITSGSIALEYLPIMAELDAVLLEYQALPDEDLIIDSDDGEIQATRSLILSQAVMHSAEHKGQIAAIMKQHGHHFDLDALDIWNYASETRNDKV